MHNVELALEASWQILLWSLLLGAGLPTVFALGIRSLAWGAGGPGRARGRLATRARPGRRGLVLRSRARPAVALAITYIVASGFGKALDFEHVVPTLTDKA